MTGSLRIITTEQVVRVTAVPSGQPVVVTTTPQAVVRISEVGLQGPPGQRGEPGEDGEGGVPEVLDGGNF